MTTKGKKGTQTMQSKKVSEDGWEDISVNGPQSWHVCEPGNTVQGKLLDRKWRKETQTSKGKWFYRIEATGPTKVARKEEPDEPAVERETEAGEIVCVDERKDLEDLQALCEDGGEYMVRLTPLEKIALPGGQSFWRWQKQKKVLRRPPPRPIDKGDNIPF